MASRDDDWLELRAAGAKGNYSGGRCRRVSARRAADRPTDRPTAAGEAQSGNWLVVIVRPANVVLRSLQLHGRPAGGNCSDTAAN